MTVAGYCARMTKLGDRVRDAVSGWEGIATARYEYLNGCVRWQIDGVDKDGKPEGFVFDDQQVQVVMADALAPVVEYPDPAVSSVGGPRSNTPVAR